MHADRETIPMSLLTTEEQEIEASQVAESLHDLRLAVLCVDVCTADVKGTASKKLQSSTDVFSTSVLP